MSEPRPDGPAAGWLASASVLVTGAGGGIGSAACGAFLSHGAHVTGLDLNDGWAEQVDAGLPGKLRAVRGDVTRAEDVATAVQEAYDAHGRLDVVIAGAGIQTVGSVEETTEQAWRKVIDVNLTGTWLTCKYAVPALRASGGGTILCLASTTALHPRQNLGAYCVSKAGVGMLVRVLGREVANEGIRVVGVCPTGVETPLLAGMIGGLRAGRTSDDRDAGLMAAKPVQRWLTADEVAGALVWLTSPAGAAVTGSLIPIDFASA
ncbi:MAG: SDR family oxidoreductase [Nitriliruptorales bacterium]|nr:SDR family oxidoreductase [Nitriliruptorales bacterium]